MSVYRLTEHHLEFLSLKEGSTGWSESALVKTLHCWKSHVAAHLKMHKSHDVESTGLCFLVSRLLYRFQRIWIVKQSAQKILGHQPLIFNVLALFHFLHITIQLLHAAVLTLTIKRSKNVLHI